MTKPWHKAMKPIVRGTVLALALGTGAVNAQTLTPAQQQMAALQAYSNCVVAARKTQGNPTQASLIKACSAERSAVEATYPKAQKAQAMAQWDQLLAQTLQQAAHQQGR